MSSCSNKRTWNGEEVPLCYCNKRVEILTCWKFNNPGRRFCRCYKFGARDGCRFWRWYDEEAAEQYKRVINGLLKKTQMAERKEAHLKLLIGVIGFVAVVFGMMFVWCVVRFRLIDE